MYLECPVVAVNAGGPTETVVDGKTGFLCEQRPEAFAVALYRLIEEPKLGAALGRAGKAHVQVCCLLIHYRRRSSSCLTIHVPCFFIEIVLP